MNKLKFLKWVGIIIFVIVGIGMVYFWLHRSSGAERTRIGEISTTHYAWSPDNKIIFESFRDPAIPDIACVISRAIVGGVSGAVGVAEDSSEFSIACRKVVDGDITVPISIARQEVISSERISAVTKTLSVTRIIDTTTNMVVYSVTSTHIVDGSPKNAISAVWVENKLTVK